MTAAFEARLRAALGEPGTLFAPSGSFAYEDTLVGLHGSLTSTEMLIPILVG